MLAAGDGDASVVLQLFVAASVVGDNGFFEPAELEGLEEGQHAFGIIEGPAHVGVGHQIDVVADHLAHVAYELDVFLHAGGAVEGSPPEAQLHHLVAFVFVLLSFGTKFGNGHGVETAGVDGDVFFGASAEKSEDRLFRIFAEEIPQRDVDGRDRSQRNAFAAKGQRAPIHLLPQVLDVPGVGANQQWFQDRCRLTVW